MKNVINHNEHNGHNGHNENLKAKSICGHCLEFLLLVVFVVPVVVKRIFPNWRFQ